jgi:hypothetical protein
MVWAGITSDSKTPLVFIEEGVKVDQKIYCQKILGQSLLPWAKTHFRNRPWIFLQDSAPAHGAKMTQQRCRLNLPDFFGKEEWPPYSPDLNPLDYSIWSLLERKVCATSHPNLASLRAALIKAWDEIFEDTLRRVVDNFPKRLDACIKNRGGYIENI